MTRVVVDQDIAPVENIIDGLPQDWEIEVGIAADIECVVETLDGVDILLTTSRITVSKAVLSRSPSLQLIGKIGTGIDNIDLNAAAEHNVPVVYTPGYNALSVAELALGLLLGAARRFTQARRLLESGRWRDEFTLGTRVTGSTVGIVGLGNVGKRLANLLRGFDVDVLFTDPYIPSIDGELVAGTAVELETLLEQCDFVCLTPELTQETTNLIDAAAFDRMKDSAILVNTSRGPVVDESALVQALEDGKIVGCGLDVYADEPLSPENRLLEFDEVVCTPHAGAMTHADREKTITNLTRSVRAMMSGESVNDEFVAVPRDT